MRTLFTRLIIALALLALSTINSQLSTSLAQGTTAFTYQGRLNNNGNPAYGTYDMTFTVYGASSGGAPVAGPLTNSATGVTNGLFTLPLDFGGAAFSGAARWMEIGVRTNGSVAAYAVFSPRQPLTPAPYAITASNLTGVLPVAQLSGTVGNAQLANNSLTVHAGPGLSGGGTVLLGGTTSLTNAGVLAVAGNADITAATANGTVTLGDTATNANTASTIVKRDGSGNFSAGTITLSGSLNLPATTASAGIIYSGGSRVLQAYSSSGNFFAGVNAGNFTMTGQTDTGLGASALQENTSGGGNTASGYAALFSNTNGSANTADGAWALEFNTSGSDNTAVGFEALDFNTSGSDNTASGYRALVSNTNGFDNTAIGSTALFSNTSGSDNTASGYAVLEENTTGGENTASGFETLVSNTNGADNTADGGFALANNTSGSYNTASGDGALNDNTSGSNNIALGYQAGFNLTTGSYNIDIGNNGLAAEQNTIRIGTQGTQTNTFIAGIYGGSATSGVPVFINASGQLGVMGTSGPGQSGLLTNNSANVTFSNFTVAGTLTLPASETIPLTVYSGGDTLWYADAYGNFFDGVDAGNGETSGFENTATGDSALRNVTFSDDNTADGFKALYLNSSGSYNTAVGVWALEENTSGNYNTAEGFAALELNSTGGSNTAVGAEALLNNTNGYDNTASGFQALQANTSGSENTAIGAEALLDNTSGSGNTALGASALYNNTSGYNNTASGDEALFRNSSGYNNTADGLSALLDNLSGAGNTASGAFALLSNQYGGSNTASGYEALFSNINGAYNTASGAGALYGNISGNNNTASGVDALSLNTSGHDNTASGYAALYNSTNGFDNTAIGSGALLSATSGNNNTAIGYLALGDDSSGTGNIGLGNSAGGAVTSGNNNIEIYDTGQSSDNGVIRVGTVGIQTSTYIAGIYNATASGGTAVYVAANGQLGTLTSSRRYKDDIQSMANASDVLLSLRPVTFHYKPDIDPKGAPQFGLVAEEVDQVDPDLVVHDDTHGIYTVRYEAVNAMLLNEFQKEHRKVEEQTSEIQDLKARLEKLELFLNAKNGSAK